MSFDNPSSSIMPWTNRIQEAIGELAGDLPSGKLVILTESDLKVELCHRLRATLQAETESVTVNTESPWYDDETGTGPLFIDVTVFDRASLHLGYIPHLKRKGYRYDGQSVAIELKYCRYSTDIPGVIDDIKKLRSLARKPHNSCFVLALAKTPEIYTEALRFIEAAHKAQITDGHPISVYLCAAFQTRESKIWQFR